MKKNKNIENDVAFMRALKIEDKPIQLSRKNIYFIRTIKSAKTGPSEDMFIVPWQQFEE